MQGSYCLLSSYRFLADFYSSETHISVNQRNYLIMITTTLCKPLNMFILFLYIIMSVYTYLLLKFLFSDLFGYVSSIKAPRTVYYVLCTVYCVPLPPPQHNDQFWHCSSLHIPSDQSGDCQSPHRTSCSHLLLRAWDLWYHEGWYNVMAASIRLL